jgi:predicted RNase H-like HicB family nuclease
MTFVSTWNEFSAGYLEAICEEADTRYHVILEESEEGFAVSVPSLPGCHSQGETEQEALENIADAIRDYLAAREELKLPVRVREAEVEV